jgi:hypothetical protein
VSNGRLVEEVFQERAQDRRCDDDQDDDRDSGIASPRPAATVKAALIAPAQGYVLTDRLRHPRRAYQRFDNSLGPGRTEIGCLPDRGDIQAEA